MIHEYKSCRNCILWKIKEQLVGKKESLLNWLCCWDIREMTIVIIFYYLKHFYSSILHRGMFSLQIFVYLELNLVSVSLQLYVASCWAFLFGPYLIHYMFMKSSNGVQITEAWSWKKFLSWLRSHVPLLCLSNLRWMCCCQVKCDVHLKVSSVTLMSSVFLFGFDPLW